MRTAALLFLLALPAGAAPPTLTSLFPAGGQVGTTVDVTAAGTFDSWPVEAWSSSPDVSVKAAKEKGKFKVAVAATAKPGVAWLRLHTPDGASGPRPFVVGVLPEVAEQEPNDEAAKPQAVAKSCVVNGKLAKTGDVDCFAVTLTKGQTLVASLLAHHTLRSPTDAVLQVVSPDGFVLDQNHDHHGLDPQLEYTAAKDGPVVVRVFAFPSQPDSSIRFFGSEACVYRLTLTTAGFVDYELPLAVAKAAPVKLQPVGWNLTTSPVVPSVIAAREEEHPCFDFTAKPADGPLTPPFTLTGRVKEANATNAYAVKVTKGQTIAFQVESRRLELPLTPVLRVLDSAGKELARAEPGQPNADCETSLLPTKDDTLRVEVRDLYRHGGPRFVYRLRAVPPTPSLDVTVPSDRLTATAGTPLEVPLASTFKGGLFAFLSFTEVELKAEGLPAEVAVAVTKDRPAKLRLTAPTAGLAKPFRLTLVAAGKGGYI